MASGRHLSDEHRRKISEAHKGMHPSDETRRKLSEFRKGRSVSDETRRKISEAQKGKRLSDEHRRKISEALKGRQFSVEHRMKLADARLKRDLRKAHCSIGRVPKYKTTFIRSKTVLVKDTCLKCGKSKDVNEFFDADGFRYRFCAECRGNRKP